MQSNARLAVVVACISVTAVAVGGAVAYRQVPSPASSAATPLTDVATSSSPVSKTPSSTPSTPLTTQKPVPTPTPSLTRPPTSTPGLTGPVKVSVDLAKLGKGKEPQIPYLIGRVVRGGDGPPRTIPGTDTIGQIVRSGTEVLAVVSDFTRSRLIRIGPSDKATYTADVTSLVGGEFGNVAYAAVPDGSDGSGGGTVYYERAGSQWKLDVPAAALGLEVLGLQNANKVYYRWQSTVGGHWNLFEWLPGSKSAPTPQQVKSVVSADYVSADGVVAGSISDSAPAEGGQTCSTVTLLATGKRLWRTCDSWVQGFTPDHSVTLGTGGRGDEGTAKTVTAQETATGKVLREWAGAFEVVAAEDDQHLLIVSRSGVGGSKGSIIRCDVNTGGCEFAVGLTGGYLSLSGLGR